MVAEQKRMEHEKGSSECDEVEAHICVPQQRRAVGYPCVRVGGRREGLDTAHDTKPALQGGCDRIRKKKPRDLSPLELEKPTSDKKLMLEIRGEAKQL